MGGSAYIGLSPAGSKDSFSYHGSTGNISSDGEVWRSYGPTFGYNDVVGCGVIGDVCFFTKNKEFLGVAFRDVPPDLHPTVGLWNLGDTVGANFGDKSYEFELDWDDLRRLCGL